MAFATKWQNMVLLLISSIAVAGDPPSYRITTLAPVDESGKPGVFQKPSGVDVDKSGNIYVADQSHQIRKITPDQRLLVVAGTGEPGFAGDGGPAVKAQLNRPYGVRLLPDGRILIADARNNRIRLVDQSGVISTLAGNGKAAWSGDGGPAHLASLNHPDDMVMRADGTLFIADAGNDRIRKVTPDGKIHTVAGSGKRRYHGDSGFSGDGGPAVDAMLWVPAALSLDNAGNLYFADLLNHAIRKIDRQGVITTIAGQGFPGFWGDGLPARKALLREPGGLAFLQDGSLVFADGGNARIRRVGVDGLVHTIAGNGLEGIKDDGGPAALARMTLVDHLVVAADGRIIFGDYDNHRIRVLTPVPAPSSLGSVQTLLARMRRAYASLEALRMEVDVFRRDVNYRVDLNYKAPGKLRANITTAGKAVTVVSDGYRIEVRDPERPGPERFSYHQSNLARLLPSNLEVISLFDFARHLNAGDGGFMNENGLKLKQKKWNDKSWTVLEEAAGDLVVDYYVDPERHVIMRTRQVLDGTLIYDGKVMVFRPIDPAEPWMDPQEK